MRTAEQCFGELGYSGTTVDDISKAAGISRSTFYVYYENKFSLVAMAIEQIRPRMIEIYRELGPIRECTQERFRAWIEKLVGLLRERTDVYSIWISAGRDPEVARLQYSIAQEIAAAVGIEPPAAVLPEDKTQRRAAMTAGLFLWELAELCTLTAHGHWSTYLDDALDVYTDLLFNSTMSALQKL
jgi:AcrR family transcriptional regulator